MMSTPADSAMILDAIADPLIVADEGGEIIYANPSAEAFFGTSVAVLRRGTIEDIAPYDSPLRILFQQVREVGGPVSEYGVLMGTPKSGVHTVNIQLSPLLERPGAAVIQIEELSMASKMDRSLTHLSAARAVTGMASMLAHEVKNPLSGIRGAAQLLEQSVNDDDQALTRLIVEEVARIVELVNRMEVFSAGGALQRSALNIHEVLERVRLSAQTGFARHVRISEQYDPSLPMVLGNRDELIQVFMNLVKNAAESVPQQDGEITIKTAYRHGVRLAIPGTSERVKLPLEVTITDNGPGIPEEILPHLFEPFVTTKSSGTGLGLALVAKIIGDHGGIIEVENTGRGALFRIHLPVDNGQG